MTKTPLKLHASNISDWADCARRAWFDIAGTKSVAWLEARETAKHNSKALAGVAAHAWLEKRALGGTTAECKQATENIIAVAASQTIVFEAPHHTASDILIEAIAICVTAEKHPWGALWQAGVAAVEPTWPPLDFKGIQLAGRPDLYQRDTGLIVDLKCGRREPRSAIAQLGAYALQARANGLPVRQLAVVWARPTEVKILTPSIKEATKFAINLIRRADRALGMATTSDDVGANPLSKLCTPQYCPAWEVCGVRPNIQEEDQK